MQTTLAEVAVILGLRRIQDLPSIDKRAVESVHEEIDAAARLLASLPAIETIQQDGSSQDGQAVRELIVLIDRIAESDATAANDLRRRLTAKLFASTAGGSGMEFWLLREGGTAEIPGTETSTLKEIRTQIVSALQGGAARVRTSSLLAAYFAALADIPTELEIRKPVGTADIPLLRDLARLPSAELLASISDDLEDRLPEAVADLLGGRGALLSGRRSSIHQVTKPLIELELDANGSEFSKPDGIPHAEAAPGARILWLYGSENQSGWAYGINAQRLASSLPRFRHAIGEQSRSRWTKYDIKFSFDVLILRRRRLRRVRAKKSVLRVGGAGPLHQVAGDNPDLLVRHLSLADAIITLSPELERRLSELHSRVYFIPNGIDLRHWNPAALSARDPGRPFRAGIAASLRSESEKDVKGYEIAVEACRLAGIPLLAVGRGVRQVPHGRMIEDFYSEIDVLLHPTAPGKEACSNVVMEALALGIPVVTTRYAGMHGQLLSPWLEALVVPRSAMGFAAAVLELKRDGELRDRLAAGGRRFAERFHDLELVGLQYARVFDIVLQSN